MMKGSASSLDRPELGKDIEAPPDGLGSREGRAVGWTADSLSSLRAKFGAGVQPPQAVGGCFLPGQLAGVIGGAHSGKTALLRVLAGRRVPGSTFASLEATPGDVALVEAFDVAIPNLTVDGQLRYAADLSNRAGVCAAEKAARVEDAIRLLGLEAVRNRRVGCPWTPGGIPDEDVRRVSIGVALVSAPAVLLVDSPTAGLPAAAVNRIMRTLKTVAQRGLAVVVALEAPTATAYAQLDRVLLLAAGRPVYSGPPGSRLVTYFETQCPAAPTFGSTLLPESEWLLEALEQADALADAYEASAAARAATEELEQEVPLKANGQAAALRKSSRCGSITPAWHSLWTLFRRRTLVNLCDPAWVLTRTLDKLYFCLLIMSLYWHRASLLDPASLSNMISILWMLALLPMFHAAMYISALIYEMPAFVRERNAGWYSGGVYWVHKMGEEVALAVLMTLAFSCILYFPLQLHGSWLLFWLVYLTTSVIGLLFGYLLATLSPSPEIANGLVPLVLISALFFAGCLLRDVDIPRYWHWATYVNPMKYSYGALMVNEFGGRPGLEPLLAVYSLETTSKWAYLGYEAAFVGGMGALLWVALHFKRSAPQYRVSIALRRN